MTFWNKFGRYAATLVLAIAVASCEHAELPTDAALTVVPDWVCEILSPTTRRHNLLVKKPYYAKIGVRHLWIVDLSARTVAASRLQDGLWVELGVWGDEKEARIEPFGEVALDVASWW